MNHKWQSLPVSSNFRHPNQQAISAETTSAWTKRMAWFNLRDAVFKSLLWGSTCHLNLAVNGKQKVILPHCKEAVSQQISPRRCSWTIVIILVEKHVGVYIWLFGKPASNNGAKQVSHLFSIFAIVYQLDVEPNLQNNSNITIKNELLSYLGLKNTSKHKHYLVIKETSSWQTQDAKPHLQPLHCCYLQHDPV